jgi:hypothetical protein
MNMQGRRLLVGSLAALVATACMGFAHNGNEHKTSGRTASITFANAVKLGSGATLSAGTYRMEVMENTSTPTVTFSHHNKVVATASATLVAEASKNPATEVDIDQHSGAQNVIEIRPSGWKEALRFNAKGQ